MDITAFIHLSDLHVAGAGAEHSSLLSDTAATLDAVVAILRGTSPPPSFVAVSGQHAAVDPLHADELQSVRGTSFGLCRLGPAGFTVTFVQLPSDRAGLERLPADLVKNFS